MLSEPGNELTRLLRNIRTYGRVTAHRGDRASNPLASLCVIYCGEWHCDRCFPSTSVFPHQYHSTNAPYPFIHLPPTLYNVSLPVLQFSPVSTIPPMLHTHSFTYHPHYIMFLSQHFSFPPSVSFHQRSIPIHSPTTHTIYCFSPSTSVFPCQYHSTNAPYPFIHLPPTLYNIFFSVLQFSPFSIIPPMLHTHSFSYHPHYIMFLSQCFSFFLSVSFHQCSIPIYSPTTHAI